MNAAVKAILYEQSHRCVETENEKPTAERQRSPGGPHLPPTPEAAISAVHHSQSGTLNSVISQI